MPKSKQGTWKCHESNTLEGLDKIKQKSIRDQKIDSDYKLKPNTVNTLFAIR